MTDPRRPTDEDELDADEFPDEEAAGAEEDMDAASEPRPGARVPRAAGRGPAGRAVPERASTPAAAGEELPYVDDRVSKVWVALIVIVFAAIFVYGLLLGRGGWLTAPSPAPSATAVPSSTPSPVRTQTLRPSVSPAASATASGSPAPTTVASPRPTGSPPVSPAVTPLASP